MRGLHIFQRERVGVYRNDCLDLDHWDRGLSHEGKSDKKLINFLLYVASRSESYLLYLKLT